MKHLFLVFVLGICAGAGAVTQVTAETISPSNSESSGRIPLPAKAGMFGIETENKTTLTTPPKAPASPRPTKPDDNRKPNSTPSNEKLAKVVRDQTHAINLLFIELNSIKERIDAIETKQR